MNITDLERIFHKIILHLRLHQRKHKLVNQFCKRCGHEMGYDYSIKNKDWEKIPEKYQNHVLCWNCFCDEYPSNVSEVEVKFCGGKKFLDDWEDV